MAVLLPTVGCLLNLCVAIGCGVAVIRLRTCGRRVSAGLWVALAAAGLNVSGCGLLHILAPEEAASWANLLNTLAAAVELCGFATIFTKVEWKLVAPWIRAIAVWAATSALLLGILGILFRFDTPSVDALSYQRGDKPSQAKECAGLTGQWPCWQRYHWNLGGTGARIETVFSLTAGPGWNESSFILGAEHCQKDAAIEWRAYLNDVALNIEPLPDKSRYTLTLPSRPMGELRIQARRVDATRYPCEASLRTPIPRLIPPQGW